MSELFRLADNPLFVKHLRSRFRRSGLVSSLSIVLILSSFLLALDISGRAGWLGLKADAEPIFFFLMLALQWVILNVIGGSQVATAIAFVKDSGILDYHRITPLPSKVQTLGFVLGAPIREHFLFAVTAPFSIALCLIDGMGIEAFCKCYLVLFACSLLSHSLALLVGLSSKSSRGASGRYVAILFLLNFSSNQIAEFGRHLGLAYVGPALISPMPVIREVFDEVEERRMQQRNAMKPPPPIFAQVPQGKAGFPRQAPNQPQFNNWKPPAPPGPAIFFGLPIPLIFQTLLVQGTVIYFLFIAASRRIRSDRLTLLSKGQTLSFFACMCLLVIGTLWKFNLQGLVITNVYALMVFGLVLLGANVQSGGEIRKGYQRALRLSKRAPNPWSEASGNQLLVLSLSGLMALYAAAHFILLNIAQAMNLEGYIGMFGIAMGTIFSGGFLLQQCMLRYRSPWQRFGLYLFFLWIAPLLVAFLMKSFDVRELVYLLAVTPITSMPFMAIIDNFGAQGGIDVNVFRTIAIVTSVLESALFLYLSLHSERRIRNEVAAEHEEDEVRIIEVDAEEGIEP